MKKVRSFGLCLLLTISMSSCYVSTYVVGNGASDGTEQRGKNQYFLGGVVTGKQTDIKNLSEGKSNYLIESKFTFVDMLLNSVTFGIYSPRTVIVKK